MATSSRDCQRIVPTTSSCSSATSRGSTSVRRAPSRTSARSRRPPASSTQRVEGGAAGRRDHGVPHRSPGRRPRPAWNAAAGSGRPPSCCRISRRSACPSPQATSTPSWPAAMTVPGGTGAATVRHGAAMHDHAPAVADQRRVRPRVEPAHLVVQRRRRPPPVHRRIGAGDLRPRRWRGARPAAPRRPGPAAGDRARRTSSAAPSTARTRSSSSLVMSGSIRHRHASEHRPGVELLHHAHDRDAGLAAPVENRPVHGCGAAIRRQQRARAR